MGCVLLCGEFLTIGGMVSIVIFRSSLGRAEQQIDPGHEIWPGRIRFPAVFLGNKKTRKTKNGFPCFLVVFD
jgi:hypothetical protein